MGAVENGLDLNRLNWSQTILSITFGTTGRMLGLVVYISFISRFKNRSYYSRGKKLCSMDRFTR